ncbi:hypothetical protein CFC21_036922 [Triticum aestivum]|uniref:Transcription initiation factor TFIID subunit 12 domain-containing protein n=3 Tax=Triticum TaxID=4564 RepID=A0A9R0VPC6_TRITD|nr:hypothetical protein CFC21_036922 [Triticum aestivum]VAH66363.1 unnamed protein product [Triticum turgidum subsp. durum]
MADPPSVAAIASPQPDQLGGSASAPQNSNPNSLLSPQIPPSPTVSDLSVISSPQLDPAAAAAGGGSADFPPRPQQLQAPSPTQAVAGAGGYGQIQRSGSASRLAAASQLPQYSAATARMYGGQMSFSGGGAQLGQQQQQQLAARAAMLGQGQLGMMQGQGSAASAAHYGLQSQMMAQPRQKGMVQGAQFNTANAAQALQGMQSMGVMGTLGMNQMRPNGTIPYAQQRFAQAQMRPQQASQQAALSPQGVAQGLSRTASITGLNSQLPGVSQNGQMMQMSPSQQQQQWLKQMQSSLASPSQHQIQQQHRMLLMQQLQKTGLTPHQIAQAQQQHPPHLNAQQLMQQQHIMQQLQQQQQQQSPRMSASGSQKSANLTGSQPGTPLSGGTMAGGSGSQGAEGTNQLLGKRKIQDLVAQVDPLGKLDPEVEDLVLEIADDFIESVTAFACTLAKHRKSSVLEAKDVLLHLQRNWHLTVPGFSKEDKNPQRNYVKAVVDPQQPECDAAGVRSASNKLVANNSIANHQTRGPVADPSPTSTVGPLSKVPRF